ncbi:hypothetical protein [Salipaludibacillus aurantiacus]|uniref:Uncharacterized protein n=1 Tax=Salipaludibacillus aurantiacus TaxID=1601833 RepID=A0A1H9TZ27_9BACI|nr:hypothetical protein [Salipaludibacillus aurantiacus]SES02505.1 hypothetical protein SAMN05518684_106189 [Salipaludibacillus aurantiacus]
MSLADKMMRLAGRAPNGTAKALTTDSDGKLNTTDSGVRTEIEALKAENQAIKQALEGTLKTEVTGSNVEDLPRLVQSSFGGSVIYNEGAEAVTLEDSIVNSGASIEKKGVFLHLIASDEGGASIASFTTAQKITLQYIKNIYIDWEQTGNDNSSTQSRFALMDDKTTNPLYSDREVFLTGNFSRKISTLNVADYKDQKYLRITARDGSATLNARSELKVYNIWVEFVTTKKDMSPKVDVSKRNVLSDLTILPETTETLVEDFGLPENISSWSLYALEVMRPIDNLIADMKIIIEFSDIKGNYDVGSGNGLLFSQIFEVSDFDEDEKVFVTSRGELGVGSNIIIKDKFFTQPIAKYLRIRVKNTRTSSNMRLQKPTLLLEGNF